MIKGKIKRILKSIMFLVISLAIGFFIGFMSEKFFGGIIGKYITNGSIFSSILKTYGLILIFIIGYLVHIIIHEFGHLVFGLMTGYTFISFRVASFMIVKEEGKFKFKRYSIPGTAGQCLMMPPDFKDDELPFVIYNYGGVIMNLIVSILAILIVIFVDGVKYPLNVILVLSSVGGIFAALSNGIPLKIGGIPNDGHNVMSMLKDEEAKRGFHLQLTVNGLQHQGVRIKDMPLEMFKLKEGADITSPLNTSIRLMEYAWHLDSMDLESARKCINSFIPYMNKLIPIYRYEINCERIFLELVGDCDKKIIDRLYTEGLKKYVKRAKFMLSKRRLLLAYECFYNENQDKALKYYEELKQLGEKSPAKADADSEIMISDWLMERL